MDRQALVSRHNVVRAVGNPDSPLPVAMMAAGWDGAPSIEAPGFPKTAPGPVRAEGPWPAL